MTPPDRRRVPREARLTRPGKGEGVMPASPWRGAAGRRCYAIGDVHGRLDKLEELLGLIEAHHRGRPPADAVLVVLGDMIDRGPASRQVIDRLLAGVSFVSRLIVLKGNHEEMLLKSLEGSRSVLESWLESGGAACAASYGLNPARLTQLSAEAAAHNLAAAIPAAHIAFLETLPDSVKFGDYLLVHAGIRPGRRLEEQSPKDLRWIRKGFLDSRARHEWMVVHGHCISPEIDAPGNRIGIDTGAWTTGRLTAIWIEETEHGFLQTQPDPPLLTLPGTSPVA